MVRFGASGEVCCETSVGVGVGLVVGIGVTELCGLAAGDGVGLGSGGLTGTRKLQRKRMAVEMSKAKAKRFCCMNR
jgi:hypothetical protein